MHVDLRILNDTLDEIWSDGNRKSVRISRLIVTTEPDASGVCEQ